MSIILKYPFDYSQFTMNNFGFHRQVHICLHSIQNCGVYIGILKLLKCE